MKTFATAAALAAILVSAPVAQAASWAGPDAAGAATQSYPAYNPYASSRSDWSDYATTYTGRSTATDDLAAVPDSHVIGSGDRHATAPGGPVGGFKSQP